MNVLTAAWRFRRFVRGHTGRLGAGVVLILLSTGFALAGPWPLQVIVDAVIGQKPMRGVIGSMLGDGGLDRETLLIAALAAWVLIVGIGAVLDFASDNLMNGAGERITISIRNALFAHLQSQSLSFHGQQRAGDLVSRVTTDIDRLQSMLIAVFDILVPNTMLLVGIAAIMLIVDLPFGLLALTVAPPLFVATFWYSTRIKRANRRARTADAAVAAQASETLAAMRSVQAFSREEHEEARFAERNDESLDASLTAVRLKAAFPSVVNMISLAGTLLVTYFGVHRIVEGTMTVGLLLVFLSYLNSLYKPMRALSRLAYTISQGTVSAERVNEILQTDERVPERASARPAPRFRGAVAFRDVTFRYTETQGLVLDNVSFAVEPGERVGIVGPSGSGKSTLLSLIPRFFDPESGSIEIDGVDLRDYQLATLRRQISLVLQEPVLFYGTILENIRYGDPTASTRRVLEAVEAANVDEFLTQLPNGLDTLLGERGVNLSGGQRQRITIARAMVTSAPIVLLDEPTTGLDAESERLVLEGLDRLSAGRTTFLITHLQRPLANVDRILEIRHGRIAYRDNRPPAKGHGTSLPAASLQ